MHARIFGKYYGKYKGCPLMKSLVFHEFYFPNFAPMSICHQMSTTLLLKIGDVIYE